MMAAALADGVTVIENAARERKWRTSPTASMPWGRK